MRKHIDQEKLALERDAVKRLTDLLETGDEDAFVKVLKEWKPNIGPEELVRLVNGFRAALAEKRGLDR